MKYNFTRLTIMRTLLIALCCVIGAVQAVAQSYTASVVQTGGRYTGLASDNDGNLYVLRHDGSATNVYQLEKWMGGNPASAVVLRAGLNAALFDYPSGVAVNSANGDVFVLKPDAGSGTGGEIIRIPGGVPGTGTVVQSGRFFTAICLLKGTNELLALEWDGGTNYRGMKYTATGTGAGTQLFTGVQVNPSPDGTAPWGMAVDQDNNVYVTDSYGNSDEPAEAGIMKFTAPGYARTNLQFGRHFTSLYVDAGNTLFAIEQSAAGSANYKLMKYDDPSQVGTEIYPAGLPGATALSSGFGEYPWGITGFANGDLFVNDGFSTSPANGRVVKLAPVITDVNIVSITRITATPTNASSIQFLVTFSGPVNNVTASNFIVTVRSGSVTGNSIANITGSGNTRTVTVNTGTGAGVLRLDMTNTTGITPTVTNPMPYTSGETITLDKTAPTGSVAINNNASYTNAYGVTLNVTGNDANGPLTMAFSADGTNYSAYEPFAATKSFVLAAPDGTKTVYYRLKDAAGNEAVFQDNIILDRTAPGTGIPGHPPVRINSHDALFTFSSDDPTATFEYKLDGAGGFLPASSPLQLFGLPAGPHTIEVRAIDAAGNLDPTPEIFNWIIDLAQPLETSTAVPAAGTYRAGQQLAFTVTFNEDIKVDNSGGVPYMEVTIGSTTVHATYVSTTGANLLFRYLVQAGVVDNDGITLGSSIILNGGTIKDEAGNDAVLTLDDVQNTSGVLVDAVGPIVTHVETPAADTYTLNEILYLGVVFDEDIIVTGTPSIPVTIGNKTVQAIYVDNPFTPPGFMIFGYQIVAGDMDDDGITPGSAIELNGGSIKDAAGNNAALTLNNVESTSGVLVNTKQPVPAISSATTSPVTGPFTITISFDDDITDNLLASHFNAVGVILSNVTRTGANAFTALVTPPAGQQTGNSSVTVQANSVHNAAGNPNVASNTFNFTWDTKTPTVVDVTPPANGTYSAGEVIRFTITYDEDVVVTGAPTVPITIGSTIRQAAYSAGGDARTLVFSYTVVNGDQDNDGIDRGAIDLNGGTIRDLAGNYAPSPVANYYGGILVDAAAPTVNSVAVPADGYYKAGQTLRFTVHTSEMVTVTGSPSLGVNIGGLIRQAAYKSGSGTTSLEFEYNVIPGDNDMDGIALTGLQLNGGTLQDAAGNAMVLTLNNVASTEDVFVNTVIPTVTLSGTPVSNGPWTLTITFSEAVSGFTLADIAVTNATLSALNTSDNITFTVQVTAGADGLVMLAVPAVVATNIGGNGNATSNTISYTHDNSAPVVVSVNVPASGGYKSGAPLEFTVNFNEPVTVTGTPSLPITIGSTTRQATYVSNAGGGSLLFRYTVQNGELDNDGIAVGVAIRLNGGTIKDAASNNAVLTLNSIDNTSGVIVDAVAPVVTSVTVPANGYYRGGQQLNFTVHFSENVTPSGVPAFPITIGTTVVNAQYTGSGSGTTALEFSYTVQPGDSDEDGIAAGNTIVLNPGTIKDGVGNDAVLALNNVANTSGVLVITDRPTVTFSGVTGPNVAWTATFVFNREVTGFTIDDIALTNAVASDFQVVSGTTYTALISPQVQGAVSVQVPANVAEDLAGNLNEASGTLVYSYDPNPPFITSVEVPANGYYKQGDVLAFAVNWNEIVKVNSTPSTLTLPVVIGNNTVQADFTGGFNTQRLTFAYTVQTGDLDLDGIQLGTALQIQRTDVRFTDQSNNLAILTLNGVPVTSGILVHTGRPSVTLTSAADARVNAPFTVTATFNEPVTQLTAGDFTVANATVSNLQTSDNITYTLTVTPGADGAVTISLPENVAENIVNNGNTASNSISRNYDGTAPVISAASFSVLENSAIGTAVGTLSASDASGTIENWTIVSDGSGGAFDLDENGNITVKDVAILNSHAGTTVTVTITVSDGLNTSAATAIDIEVLAVNRPPTLDPITGVSLCANTETHIIQLTGASAVEPHQTYSFSVASNQAYFDVLTVDASGLLTYQLKPSVTSGTATVTVTIKDNGGTANGGVDTLRRSFTITVNSLPVVNITSNKGNTVSKGDTIRLTATGGATYNWADVNGIISGQNTAVLTTRVADNTTYTVTAISAAGCRTTATINIAALEDFKVDATNILTPNGDGRNDRFVVRNLDVYPDNELRIFDRAGRQVYQQRNYNNTWDGTINGRPLAEGTYYYILTIQGGKKVAKGFITIIQDRY